MDAQSDLIHDLQTLNHITRVLNHSVDVQSALQASLAELIRLMGLETGWIFLTDPLATDRWSGRGYRLAAFHNLPPAMALTNPEAWDKGCDCQSLCNQGELDSTYNEVRCSRLGEVSGDRGGLNVHASAPLRSGERTVGILNVAATDWGAFDARNLALLSNVGDQIGVALERARLYDMVQEQRFHEQAALLDLSQQLLSRREVGVLMSFIAEEARRLLNTDAAAVLMPTEDGEFLQFQASAGWRNDPVGRGFLVPAGAMTASGQAMATQQAVVMDDFSDNERGRELWTAKWLTDEAFVALAAVPMIADGESTGVLVVDSREPRHFQESELRLLRLMANQAALAIEKARLHEEELQRQRLDEELAVARKIQLSMLPAHCPTPVGWQFARYFEAAHQVAGDFYDFLVLPGEPGRLGIVVADVSDKGVPAALFMALSRTTIRNVALRGRTPREVLSWANRFIQEDSQSDMFLTAFYGELDTQNGRMTYANAGHNPPLIWRQALSRFELLNPTGALLGVIEDVQFPEKTVELGHGDVLIIYTDGITEAYADDFTEFGLRRLRDVVTSLFEDSPDASAETILDAIQDAVRGFVGSTLQYDDMTLLVVRRV